MPRIARLVLKGEKTVYHVMSRTALEGYVLEDWMIWMMPVAG